MDAETFAYERSKVWSGMPLTSQEDAITLPGDGGLMVERPGMNFGDKPSLRRTAMRSSCVGHKMAAPSTPEWKM